MTAILVDPVAAGFAVATATFTVVRAPSDTVARNRYSPGLGSTALVAAAFGLAIDTVVGPSICSQRMVVAPGGEGNPSSEICAASVDAPPAVTGDAVASTLGGWLVASMVVVVVVLTGTVLVVVVVAPPVVHWTWSVG